MERLSDFAADIINDLYENSDWYGDYSLIEAAINRLAAYEDTGVEPEDIARILDAYGRGMTLRTENAQRLEIVKGIQTDRLRELAQADREGRCVVLPVKLHDKLYYVDKEQVRETEVESIHNWTSGRWKLSTHTDRQSTHWIGYEVDFDGIGKTVFLTREEAEAALRREQDG